MLVMLASRDPTPLVDSLLSSEITVSDHDLRLIFLFPAKSRMTLDLHPESGPSSFLLWRLKFLRLRCSWLFTLYLRCVPSAAMTDRASQHSHDDDDHIGSALPSGVATPQLDPTDKRLPGIMHSFFAQVRAGSDSTSSSPNKNQRSSTPSPARGDLSKGDGDRSLSGSMVFVDENIPSTPSEQDPLDNERVDQKSLPTPPRSSSCSFLQKESEEAENGVPAVESGVGSVYRALRNMILSKNSSKAKRHTSYPVSSVSNDPVLAAHFSNPSLTSAPNDPSMCPDTSVSISKSSGELAKLTETAAVGPRTKNTPPLTPRAMSNETQHTEKRSGPSTTSSPSRGRPDSSRSNGHGQQQAQPTRVATVPDGQAPPVAPLKGKLTVKISEGRNLRPSFDPYVVCVFEWNEYISKGTQADTGSEQQQKKSRLDAIGGVSMQRSNSDSGRPMAIPMKSRQSSNNSLMDAHDRKRLSHITDPLWNHDAVLCVHLLLLRRLTTLSAFGNIC